MPKTLKASLAFINIPSDDPEKTRSFFEDLFGIELSPSLTDDQSFHAPISDDGVDLNVGQRHTPQESPTAYIAVDDLDAAVDLAKRSGAEVVWGPEGLSIPEEDLPEYRAAVKEIDGEEVRDNDLARAAIVVEAGGSQVGLVQLAQHAHKHYNAGRHKNALSDYRVKVHDRSLKVAKARGRGQVKGKGRGPR